MNSKEVCMELLKAESEEAVSKIIAEVPEMQGSKNWHPLDNRDTNFNITSNQASDGGKALTELMTNMVDAVLMKHALQKNIDTKGPNAPQTMYEAVDRLIKDFKGGKLTYLGIKDPWLKQFAMENLVIGVTGPKNLREGKGKPCYTFVDNGEGQSADRFEDTFLSLSAGTKKTIPFVQGKYNMGSSGVLRYSGDHWYKLIISRRYDKSTPWAWTLMRKRPDEARNSMPVVEYFILKPDEYTRKIPSFDDNNIYPFYTREKEIYDGVKLTTGTIVKLYDYNIGPKFVDFKGAREALIENLMETVLPFRIFDFRQKADPKRTGDRAKGVDARPFYGMEFLLLRSYKEAGLENDEEDAYGKEKTLHVGHIDNHILGKISIDAIVLKKDLPRWLKANNSNNRVFHTVNGQVQNKETRGYLSKCGFPGLKDRIIINVNASDLKFATHNDVWNGDRESISKTTIGALYLEKVTEKIKNSKNLKGLAEEIAQEELKMFAEMKTDGFLEKLIRSNSIVADFLIGNETHIKIPLATGNADADISKTTWDGGKYHPTFIRPEKKKLNFQMPINKSAVLVSLTDAENNYLQRDKNVGLVLISEEIQKNFSIDTELYNGRLILFIEPNKNLVKVGDVFNFKVGLKDDAMPEAVETEENFTIEIVQESEETDEKTKGKTPPPKGPNVDQILKYLPLFKILTKDGKPIQIINELKDLFAPWPTDFDESDGGRVEDFGDGNKVFGINYHNKYFLNDLKRSRKNRVEEKKLTLKYIFTMLFELIAIENELEKETDQDMLDNKEKIIRIAAKGLAKSALLVSDSIPKEIDKIKTDAKEDDDDE